MLANRTIVWSGRVISILLSLLFAMSAFMKMRHGPDVMQGMAHLGLPKSLITLLASVEISCAVIYAIPATAVLGAILLTGYIGGAILAHMRVGDPFFVQIGFGLFVWLGLYLRENRLKALLPLRKKRIETLSH
jgi:hypothetical protein